MQISEIHQWLNERNPDKLATLWQRADDCRRQHIGDTVLLRGLVEVSNICRRQCTYCGIRAGNHTLTRYRLSRHEILACAKLAADFGFGTVVLQAGEDLGLTADFVADVVQAIKEETGRAVTLSLGERDEADLRLWRKAGADRYLLRFETSNQELFQKIHPPLPLSTDNFGVRDRISMLRMLREIGYEIGSGVMEGIPGQTLEDLARDIFLFGKLQLDMIGCGPFLPHPDTPLGRDAAVSPNPMLSDTELPYKVIALSRLVCPRANIPSTTAIATIDPAEGRKRGLSRGANVIMPNLTPIQYRTLYSIYPNKAASRETADETVATALRHLRELQRPPENG